MLMWGPPRTGDWVVARRGSSVGIVDSLAGIDTIGQGDRGVVIDGSPSGFFNPRITVRFDTGIADRDVHVPVRSLRVVSRGRGVEQFKNRTSLLRWIRLGAALSIIVPTLWMVLSYRLNTGSFDGFIAEVAVGTVYSIFDMLEYLLTNPVQTIAFLAVSWLVWKVAFGWMR